MHNPGHDNLIPPKKGEIRNPWGRNGKNGLGGKTAKTLKELLLEKINEIDEATGKSYSELIIEQGLRQAKQGDLKFIEMLWDRLEGKPQTYIEQVIETNQPNVMIYIPKLDTEEEDSDKEEWESA